MHQAEPGRSAEDQRLINNLPFGVPSDAGPWLVAMLIGVRSNDLHGVSPTDFPEFAEAQLSEAAQEEHCLRAAEDDLVAGDLDALGRCERFVLTRVGLAHGPGAQPDFTRTESVRIALRYQDTDVQVASLPYRLGQAMHAVQDSFTHTLRAPGSGPVLHVFNFVDPALRGDYAARRDGFGHLSKLDGCTSDDPQEQERVERAVEASADLLRALGAPTLTRDQRLTHAADLLAPVVAYRPGCTPENAWCDVAHTEGVEAPSCSVGAPVPLLVLALAGWGRRRRVLQGLVLAGALLSGTLASASPWSGYVGLGASVDRAALTVDLGARLAVLPRVTLGLDVEFNPWFNLLSAAVAPGALNAYASGTWKWLEAGAVTVRSTLKLGTSVLLFDVVGTRAGSVGLFFGASLLAVSLELRPGLKLVVDPLEVDAAIPSLQGVPFVMRQYRLSVGLEQRF